MNYQHDEIEIAQPAPDRYVITGFRAMSVYIPDVGNLSPPQSIDLPMTDDLATALRAVLEDYQPPAKVPVAQAKAPSAQAPAPAKKAAPRRKASRRPVAKAVLPPAEPLGSFADEPVAQGGIY